MPHILIVKTSSLGDVVHTLPAISDAIEALDDIRFDWVVEEAFAAIPGWHPGVDQVIPVALRRWRKDWRTARRREWPAFLERLRARRYDWILDAQSLLKSAWLCLKARGPAAGPAWRSAREPLASLAYRKRIAVPRDLHAVQRTRRLFASALGYAVPDGEIHYGLDRARLRPSAELEALIREGPYVMFLHATTWATKHYPETSWAALIAYAADAGLRVLLPWGTDEEQARAQRLAKPHPLTTVVPRQDLDGMATLLAEAQGVIAVDTGLAHLAAALDTPLIGLYGATDPTRTGTLGRNQQHLSAQRNCAPCLARRCRQVSSGDPPCYASITPIDVWRALEQRMVHWADAALGR